MILDPAQYSETSPYELLEAAANGLVPLDQRLIHALVDQPERTIPDVVRFGMSDTSEHPLDLEEDIIAILRYLKTPAAIPFYIECIRREPADVSDEVVEALVPFAGEAVEPLLALYNELEEEHGGDVAFLLASLRIRDARILAILLDYFEYNASEGAFCLGLYGDPAAREALEKILADTDPKDPEDSALRAEIAEALDRLSETAEPDELLPVPDIWSLYPETDEPRFDLLPPSIRLKFFASPLANYRREAAMTFCLDEQPADVQRALLALARNDEDTEVRAAAWQALGESLDSEEIHHALHAKLDDASAPIIERAACLVSLVEEKAPAIRNHITEFYEVPEARVLALRAMWRTFDRVWSPYISKHLDDADIEIRREAVRGTGYLRISSETARLRALFNDEDLRSEALFAYALAVPFELSPARAHRLLRNVEDAGGGLTLAEKDFVELAIDERLAMNGMRSVFSDQDPDSEPEDDDEVAPEPAATAKVGRNDPCPCGSGKKYKKCCGQ